MTEGRGNGDDRLRRARWVVTYTLLGMAVPMPLMVALQWYLSGSPGPVALAGAGALATVAAALALRMTFHRVLGSGERSLGPEVGGSARGAGRSPGGGERSPNVGERGAGARSFWLGEPHPGAGERSPSLFLASFATTAGAVWALLPGAAAFVLPAAWWGMVALVVPRWWSALSGLALLALPWAHALLSGADAPAPVWIPGVLALAWVMLAGNRMSLRLWDLTREVVAGQRARSRLAASEERVRIARDIHDLLGHSLSGIAVRSELAARLTEVDTGRAADEMRLVQEEARKALREVRSTVSGYRDADLAEELEGAREVLTAAGTRLKNTVDVDRVPEHLRATAAWLVREGVTNVVRHSTARHCAILLEEDGASITLRIRNDGAPEPGGFQENRGSGILGLTQRVSAVGGTLTTGPDSPHHFELRAVLPTRRGRLPHDGGEGDP